MLHSASPQPQINLSNESDTTPTHIFFVGASWGSAFYVGVYKALQEKYDWEALSKMKFSGNSSGALFAAGFAARHDWTVLEQTYLNLAKEAIENGVFQKMSIYHDAALDVLIRSKTDGNAYQAFNGKLFVGVTSFLDDYHLISSWGSNEQLRNTMHASMHIPYYCSVTKDIKIGSEYKRAIDGGCGRYMHRFDDRTLVVSALLGGDIRCEPRLSVMECLKPSMKRYEIIKEQGYKAMMQWNGRYRKNDRQFKWLLKLSAAICWWFRMMEEVKFKKLLILVGIFIIAGRKYRKLLLLFAKRLGH